MGKFIKHNSNYIRTTRHQFLKGGSTIFERDWVTVGSQLNFGPGKIPYYNNGNFIFTTSPIPNYQKKYKNGVTVGTWTYEDVMDASSKVNQIQFDEYTEDIRSYAYYGSCVELVRATIENIINTFPGNITVSDEELGIFKNVEEFVCGGEESQEIFERVKKNGKLCFTLNNPFDINIFLKDVQLTQYDNELRYLTYSYDKYQISTNGGSSFSDIESYEVVMRKMYEKEAPPCDETIKEYITSASFSGSGQTQSISLEEGNYFIEVNDQQKLNNWTNLCYNNSDSICFSISQNAISIKTDEEGNVKLVLSNGSEQQINGISAAEDSVKIDFYKEVKIERVYKYYQMFDDVEYEQTYKSQGWVESTCIMDFWLPDSVFLNRCDEYQRNILYSQISEIGENQPVYTVTINGSIKIEGYIYNRQVIPLVVSDYQNMVIQPKDEVIEEYFNNLKGFEKQLLTRKTKPLYTNYFITPIEYDLGFLYYKRTYTWPSNGYCIDIMSPLYLDFVSKLGNLAALYDELWTDNLWRRMTHEAIKNYDWTYTREFSEGEEEDNVNGGERMHKVLNIIGRVFDDIKLSIDTIKRNNTLTYNGDRNMPNALISDKLDLKGWDIYSTIPTYKNEDDEIVSASEETITQEVLDTFSNETYDNNWYPTIDANRISFADVDIEFMRRLLISTKRIWQTKGTRHSIDMVMGMFGYGNMDEDKPNYIIKETYRTVTPKEYGVEETGFGDTIVRLNAAKKNELLYDEDASGIPVGSFAIFEKNAETGKQEPTTYLIPFYDQRKIYDGNLYFQTKGGWCYHKDGEETEIDMSKWTETLSYLHVTSQISDLLSVHPNSVKNGDIYYVVNVNDYIEYAENAEDTLYSHFFVLEDDYNPESFSSWTNINLDEEFYEESADFSEEEVAKYTEYSKKANYLDSIVPYNIGNNPHVGYGKYDMGEEFFEYMKQPFKYSFDGHNNFETIEELQEAEGISFEDLSDNISTEEISDKIQIIADSSDLKETTVSSYGGKKDLKYKEYKLEKIKDIIKTNYYLNSKVIYLENKIDNNEYKKYFLNVIIKYLMQIIPSTAIFVLENFAPSDGGDDTPKKYRVHFYDTNGTTQIHSEKVEEGQSVACYGGNQYYVRGDASRTKVSCPYGPINSETFLVKWSEPIVKYVVHFYDTNGTTEIYNQQVEKGKNVTCYGGNDYYVRGDLSRTKVSCPYGPINSETHLVKWAEEIIEYDVTFYDTNGSSILKETKVQANHTINNYYGYDYYLKEDSTKTKITTWPYTITRNTDFVRWTPPVVYYTVTFYDTDGTSVLHTDNRVEENSTVEKYFGYDYYLKGDSTQTKITTWPYTITRNTDFVKWVEPTVYYNVDFYENENDTTPIHTEQIEEGQPVNRYQDSDWYLMDDDNKQPVNFPYVINGPTKFVRLKQFTVRWDKQGEIIEPTEYNVTFYDKDGTTLLSNQVVQANAVVYNYQYNLYYRKNDETHTVVGFPVRVTQDEEFVRFVHYMVSFFDSEDSPVPIDVQYIEDGHQISPKEQFASYKWYKKGDTTKTTITFPYTVTGTTTFIKKEDYIFEFEDGTTTKNVETLYYSNSIQVNVVSKLGSIAQEFTEEHYDLSPEGNWVTNVSIPQQYNYVKPFFTINYKTVNPQNRTFKVRLTQQGSGKTLLLNVTQKAPDIGLIYNMPPIQLGDTFISPFSVDSVSVYEEGTQVLVGYGTAGRREGRLSEASFEKYLCATVTVQNGYKVVPNNTDRIIYVDAGTPSGVAHFPFKVSADGKTLTALTPSDYSGEYYTYYRGFIDGFGITNGTVEPI